MNQKRKNGFTLIELLAVIVILAIIALIAVPVILNIIDKANKSAFKDTAYGVIQAGELYFAEQQLELNGMPQNVEIELPDSRLQLKGDIPSGKVLITTDGKVSIAVKNDRYCITKGLDDTDVTVTENSETCELPGENSGSTLPAVGTSAEDCTWEQIKAIGDAGKADEYFDLGDTKTITLTDNTKVVMEIVAFNADEKADGSGTAAISWISSDLVAMRGMNSTYASGTTGGWEASEMRSWLQDGESGFYSTLPDDVKENIVTVKKTYGDYNGGSYVTKECNDNVWIPSQYEVFGAKSTAAGCEDSGVAYTDYFASDTLHTKKYDGTARRWWLRTAHSGMSESFRVVASGGVNSGSCTLTYGVALGFCS